MPTALPGSPAIVPVGAGARRTVIDAGGFSLTEARYAARQRLAPHAHRHAVLVLVADGSVREHWAAGHEEYPSASFIGIPAGEPHAESFSAERTRCLIVEVADPAAEHIRERSRLLDERCHARSAVIAGIGVALGRELRCRDEVSPLAVEGLVWQLVAAVGRHHARVGAEPEPPWLRRVRDAMHAGFRGRLRIADLAREAGVHPVYLARAFRRCHQCSPAEYIRRLRIEAAGVALRTTGASLAEVALTTGFADQSHLSRRFRRQVGVSPGRYRAGVAG